MNIRELCSTIQQHRHVRCSFPGFLDSFNPCFGLVPELTCSFPGSRAWTATTGEGNIPVSGFSHPLLPPCLKAELFIFPRASQCCSSFQHLYKHRQFPLPNFPSDKLGFSRQISVRSSSLTVLSSEKKQFKDFLQYRALHFPAWQGTGPVWEERQREGERGWRQKGNWC